MIGRHQHIPPIPQRPVADQHGPQQRLRLQRRAVQMPPACPDHRLQPMIQRHHPIPRPDRLHRNLSPIGQDARSRPETGDADLCQSRAIGKDRRINPQQANRNPARKAQDRSARAIIGDRNVKQPHRLAVIPHQPRDIQLIRKQPIDQRDVEIGNRIRPAPGRQDKDIPPLATTQRVIARLADQPVITGPPDDGIVVRPRDKQVIPRAAVQRVIPRPAIDCIVIRPPEKRVAPRLPVDQVIPRPALERGDVPIRPRGPFTIKAGDRVVEG